MMYRDLDDVRKRLDLLGTKIIHQLWERSQYVQNLGIYTHKPDENISFFTRALIGLEDYHDSSLKRYTFMDQNRITHNTSRIPVTKREIAGNYINADIKIDVSDKIIKFYIDSIQKLCREGDDPFTLGEIVECDASTIVLLNERISLGKYVAESKVQKDPSLLLITDPGELTNKLRNLPREEEVLKRAESEAIACNLDPDLARYFFEWIIETTIHLETIYIQKKATM